MIDKQTLTHKGVRFFCEHAEAVVFLTATPVQLASEAAVPSNRTIASEGGFPGVSFVLKVPGVMIGATGRLSSCTIH